MNLNPSPNSKSSCCISFDFDDTSSSEGSVLVSITMVPTHALRVRMAARELSNLILSSEIRDLKLIHVGFKWNTWESMNDTYSELFWFVSSGFPEITVLFSCSFTFCSLCATGENSNLFWIGDLTEMGGFPEVIVLVSVCATGFSGNDAAPDLMTWNME